MKSVFDIGSAVGGALGMIGNIFGVTSANDQNKELVERQNQLNIEQWNRENAYNHPAAQMQRLEEAGLNPNLMYGNGASSMLSAPSPEMQAAHVNPVQVDPLTMAQIAKLNAETRATDDANSRENQKQPLTLEQLDASIDSIYQSIDESESRMHLNVALSQQAYSQAAKNFADFQYLTDTMEFRIHQAFNDMTLSDIEVANEKTKYRYLEDTLKQTLANLRATYDLITAHANYYNESASVQFSDSVSHRISSLAQYGNFLTKIEEIEGQLERWDNMTINERLNLLRDGIDLGNELYNGTRVTETVTNEKGGGKPSKQTTKVSRRRRPKLKPFTRAKPPVRILR